MATDYSFTANAHPAYIDSIYQQYQKDVNSVDKDWQLFFEGFEFADTNNGNGNGNGNGSKKTAISPKEFQVIGLINGYRRRGHLLANINPIKQRNVKIDPLLALKDYDLGEADLDKSFIAGQEIGLGTKATLRQIIDRLRKIYCGSIGMEYFYIENKAKRRWLRERLENFNDNDYGFDIKKKRHILEKLNGAVGFEHFLHKKFVGQKRFSLEGGESVIPALDAMINTGASLGLEEAVIGMAHRGRLNVLANIMGKTYEHIFKEFDGDMPEAEIMGDGDVKYHLGYSSLVKTPEGKEVHLKLAPNPSHLEAVNTVVLGFARAKADTIYKDNYNKILPILIHGDAAIAGQGIVYETIQMSQLEGYKVGGTLHVVINNQIGFTTDKEDARSSTYCTSIASVTQSPVFHVNGDDPEAVVFAAELAIEYRQKFGSDVFIDIVCYRKHGHNEGDDPRFTQPLMYDVIKKHPTPRELYSKELIEKGEIEAALVKEMDDNLNQFMQERFDKVKQKDLKYKYQEAELAWKSLKKFTTKEDFWVSPETGLPVAILEQLKDHLATVPKDFNMISKFNRILKGNAKQIAKNEYNWGMAELMAYGSILLEGNDIRMSGQDVKRGTFSHRHAVLFDEKTKAQYNRLNTMQDGQGTYRIFNSFLSEYGVMGYEFGYSMATPKPLVIWEAQFGDFYNGAQIMVDQFISSSESKWQRMSGLVLLLPHGYAGQGPEHSSARIERFLQMCAEYNMTVANITTPANLFHVMRRQLTRPFRKPLIITSPKSLLRHPKCVSKLEDFTEGTRFQETYDDTTADPKKVTKVLCCTGKIYYDLLEKKEKEGREDIAIVRLEQLYPFPTKQVNALIKKYGKKAAFKWVQEEPSNMGAWQYVLTFAFHKKYDIELVARKSSASPATGFKKAHDREQADILERAFN